MKRIVLLRPKRRPHDSEAGFSLTELIAGLLVASLLIVGLIDITRRYARTTDRVKGVTADLRSAQMIDALLVKFERADPGSIKLTTNSLTADVGGRPLAAHLRPAADHQTLQVTSRMTEQSVVVPKRSHFEMKPSGTIVLQNEKDAPLAVIVQKRALPFDCQFDTVSRECRN